MSTSQLATHLRITPQGAAKTVEEMVADGYVERRSDPADGRVKMLCLTPRARALMASGAEFHAAFERRMGEELGAGKMAVVREALTAIVDRSDSPDGLARTLRRL